MVSSFEKYCILSWWNMFLNLLIKQTLLCSLLLFFTRTEKHISFTFLWNLSRPVILIVEKANNMTSVMQSLAWFNDAQSFLLQLFQTSSILYQILCQTSKFSSQSGDECRIHDLDFFRRWISIGMIDSPIKANIIGSFRFTQEG